jgi:type I restriction enzyme S subunit
MKDSGISWIGNIPNDWKCCKQKYVIKLINGRAYSESEFEEDGKYKILRVGNLFTNPVWYYSNMELEDDKYCINGDLLYSWSMSYAPVIWTGDKVIYHYHIWKAQLGRQIDKLFAYYYLIALTDALKSEIHETTMGFVTMGVMNNSYIAYPLSLDKQKQISNYLHNVCCEIDNLIKDLQEQIDTLDQYRRSIITEAVTHGLKLESKTKDSGIVWMGQIPSHWQVIKTKYLFEIVKRIAGEEGYDVLSVTQQGLKVKDLNDYGGQIAESYAGYQFVYPEDFVMNHMDLLTGWVDYSDKFGVTSPDYRVFRLLDKKANSLDYFKYVFQCCYLDKIYYSLGNGVAGVGRWRLQAHTFKNFRLPVPPLEEQVAIAKYLDEKCSLIAQYIDENKQKIAILQDYKKSIIYEYVTGKKEVPA